MGSVCLYTHKAEVKRVFSHYHTHEIGQHDINKSVCPVTSTDTVVEVRVTHQGGTAVVLLGAGAGYAVDG